MRILTINYEYPPIGGGGGFVTRDILESMAQQGHEVIIITSAYKNLPKQEHINGVEIYRVPVLCRTKLENASFPSMLSYVPSSIFKVLFSFKDKKFDIINTHFAIPSGPAGYVIAKILNISNVLSIHGGDIYDPSKPLSPHKNKMLSSTVSFILNNASLVVAQSTDTKNNAYKYYKYTGDIDVIPLGIRKPSFSAKNRHELGLKEDAVVICTIGRLVKRKNLEDAIETLSQLPLEKKVQFIIIGDGPEKDYLKDCVKTHNLTSKIKFLGNISDEEKFQFLSNSDIYISTAIHEGFGVVFLEAMECGIPVVSYDHGGQNDFLVNGKTGYLIPARDKYTLKNSLQKLIADPARRKKMGKFNKQLIPKYYINRCAEKYINTFKKLIDPL